MLKDAEKWVYSFDGEEYGGNEMCSSFEDAVKAAREELEADGEIFYGTVVYVGKVQNYVPSIEADVVLEHVSEDACDVAGEYAEGYLDGPKWGASDSEKAKWAEQRKTLSERLTAVFLEWTKETGNEPNFFTVDSDSVVRVVLE